MRVRFLRLDGTEFEGETASVGITWRGRPARCVVQRSIEDRLATDRALRESARRLENAQRIARVGDWGRDLETGEIYWSDEVWRIFGLLRDTHAPSYESIVEMIHPEDRTLQNEAVQRVLETQEGTSFDHRIVREDGEVRTLHLTIETIPGLDGRPRNLVGTLQDITDLRRTERTLEESTRRLGLVIDNAPIILFAIDREGQFILSQGHGLNALGLKPGELIGKSVFERNKDVPELLEIYKRSLTGETVQSEVKLKGRVFSTYHTPYTDAADDVIGVIGLLVDITERAQAEQALTELNKELELRVEQRTEEFRQSNVRLEETLETLRRTQDELVRGEKLAGLGVLVAGVSHELSTPIGNCVTMASVLEERMTALEREDAASTTSASPLQQHMEAFRHGVELIQRNLKRGSDLITSFKQVAVDQASEQRRVFELKTAISEIVTTLAPMTSKNNYKIETHVDDGIEMDSFPGPLAQIITNFVSNSILHGFGQRDAGKMVLRAYRVNSDRVELTFGDDGEGIDPKNLKKIFDPFFTTRRSGVGTGLGLHIIHNLVTNVLGGTIAVESTPGKGATFTVSLPVTAPAR
ncbi:MAG: PAS domain S-box protein [Rhodospirillaceae bacterium]|nr:PAS domain S-box protein [Rhodospirillaceae bacterium]